MHRLALTLALVLTACGGQGKKASPPTSPSPEPACADMTGAPQAVLEMGDNFFEPTCLQVSTDQSLTIRNMGALLHNMQLENVDLDIDVQPGEESNTEAIGGIVEAGTYKFICKYHPVQMIGELQVS